MSESGPPRPPELPVSAAEPLPSLADQIVELSALTGGLAHEIRNPLSTLKVNLQLLDEDWQKVESADEDRLYDPAEIARRSRQRIANLLDEANHLERILQEFMQCVGKRELHRSPVDLNQLVGDLVDFYRPQAEARNIVLRLVTSNEPLTVEVDQNVLKQALLNLLINAQQAMPEGGEVYVHLTRHSDTAARIDIIDNGPGIPKSKRDQIFQAYYSTKKGGSGLGLATTRQIIREHGGRIHLHSQPPHGSCFTILLPQSKQPATP